MAVIVRVFRGREFDTRVFGIGGGNDFDVDIGSGFDEGNADGRDVGTDKGVVSALETATERGAESARELGAGSGAA